MYFYEHFKLTQHQCKIFQSKRKKIPELYRVSLKDASQEVVGTSNSFQQTMTYLKY